MFATMGRHMPPPPAIATSPILWGVEEHVREVFEGTGVELTVERARLQLDPHMDLAEATDFYLSSFGPIIKARELLEPQGKWSALAAELGPVIENMLRDRSEYMIVTGTKQASGASDARHRQND
jgi:hypothetical protein